MKEGSHRRIARGEREERERPAFTMQDCTPIRRSPSSDGRADEIQPNLHNMAAVGDAASQRVAMMTYISTLSLDEVMLIAAAVVPLLSLLLSLAHRMCRSCCGSNKSIADEESGSAAWTDSANRSSGISPQQLAALNKHIEESVARMHKEASKQRKSELDEVCRVLAQSCHIYYACACII